MAENERRQISYTPLPTLKKFHESTATHRCMVGPFGSGKTSAAIIEFGYYLPFAIFDNYGIKQTRWLILRNTYREIYDTVQQPMFDDWIPWGVHNQKHDTYKFGYPNGIKVEFLFRACDRPEHARQFKSLLITGAWLEESIEISESVKNIIKGRLGRYPKLREGEDYPLKFLIESTNPPDIDHPLFHQYKWIVAPPDAAPTKPPLEDHEGFWQPPYENVANLRPGYYEDLKKVYRDSPEFADMYILSKPGAMVKGQVVYYDFTKKKHVGKGKLAWAKGTLYRGWDNTGNSPACVVCQMGGYEKIQVLKEFYHDRMDIRDFTEWVVVECNQMFPGAEFTDYADPAGENKISTPAGGFTSNAKIMADFGVTTIPSDQNWEARKSSVQRQINKDGGILVDPSCTRLINGFISGYAYPEIGTTGIYKDKPMKNRFSHVHDALQYVCVKIFRSVSGKKNALRMAAQQRAHVERMSRANV